MARCKEPIARLANAEMQTRGHFWEQRFGCRELADEGAILTCSIYVDVNQIKAGVAPSLEQSDHSAIQDRMRAWRQREAQASLEKFEDLEGGGYDLELGDVEGLLADCWLAPIQDAGPLLLVRDGPQRQAVGVVAVKGTAEGTETASEEATASSSQTTEQRPSETSDPQSPAERPLELSRAKVRHKPAAKTPPRRTIHPRLKRRQRRRATDHTILALPLSQYLEIAQWAAKQAITERHGTVPAEIANPLRSAGIDPQCWYAAVDQFERWFHRVVGAAPKLASVVARTGRRWLHGARRCRDVFT